MLYTTALIASVAACVAAVSDNTWIAPTVSDRRSPCPMMNSLANSGYINRDGLNVALLNVVNLDPAVTALVGAVAIKASTTGYADTLNLDDLDKHGIIEHDASLSRGDWLDGKGDNHKFDAAIWTNTAAHFTGDTISIEDMAKARAAAVARANATNPAFNFGAAQLQGSTLECSLILGVFGDMTDGNANTKQVRTLFEQERLPFEEGWTKPKERIVISGIQNLSKKLLAVAV
ncbi:uncharacterized protein PG998_003372 [Apiospora kogelbergensis]|uniref:uncharacterized protein n=1 Tax=Apiospora kogelbergensis TaxID=1337665 RepID=UPI00312D7838